MITSFVDLSPSHPLSKWLLKSLSCFNQMKWRDRGFQINYASTRFVENDSLIEERAEQMPLLMDEQADLGHDTLLLPQSALFVVLGGAQGDLGGIWVTVGWVYGCRWKEGTQTKKSDLSISCIIHEAICLSAFFFFLVHFSLLYPLWTNW